MPVHLSTYLQCPRRSGVKIQACSEALATSNGASRPYALFPLLSCPATRVCAQHSHGALHFRAHTHLPPDRDTARYESIADLNVGAYGELPGSFSRGGSGVAVDEEGAEQDHETEYAYIKVPKLD